jgi:adenylosuccinate synthase
MHALNRPASGLQRQGCARKSPSAAPRPQRLAARKQIIAGAGTLAEKFDAQVCVVLGTQWGDEGKGKLVDILAQQYAVVARAQVGATRAGLAAARQAAAPLARA